MKNKLLPDTYRWSYLPEDGQRSQAWRLLKNPYHESVYLLIYRTIDRADSGWHVYKKTKNLGRFSELHDAMMYVEAVELTNAKMA